MTAALLSLPSFPLPQQRLAMLPATASLSLPPFSGDLLLAATATADRPSRLLPCILLCCHRQRLAASSDGTTRLSHDSSAAPSSSQTGPATCAVPVAPIALVGTIFLSFSADSVALAASPRYCHQHRPCCLPRASFLLAVKRQQISTPSTSFLRTRSQREAHLHYSAFLIFSFDSYSSCHRCLFSSSRWLSALHHPGHSEKHTDAPPSSETYSEKHTDALFHGSRLLLTTLVCYHSIVVVASKSSSTPIQQLPLGHCHRPPSRQNRATAALLLPLLKSVLLHIVIFFCSLDRRTPSLHFRFMEPASHWQHSASPATRLLILLPPSSILSAGHGQHLLVIGVCSAPTDVDYCYLSSTKVNRH
ncbi:hypothetical protein BHM03_00050309 [Ensete ventricosum]|nr:hypothetical protein BHM03_00050309 [Ensete ventricosum]